MAPFGLHIACLLCGSLISATCFGQVPLQVDTNFRLSLQEKGASSILPLNDGKVIVSGAMKFPGNFWFTSLARFNVDGSRDNTFFTSGLGGGTIVAWGDQFYAAGPQTVRRLDLEGNPDPSFIQMNSDPLFISLQGGDYHVYPDGRVLMSGAHELLDTARGFTGLYNLIWFTNTGHVDTTKIHRKGNQVLGELEPLADGKFLVNGTCTVYEGHPVGRVFRIHADGSLDTTMESRISGGAAWTFLPLPDGRFYAGGVFIREDNLPDTLRLARFLPNGDLDPTFNTHIPLSTSNPTGFNIGPGVGELMHWSNGSILAMGNFQTVDGEPRNGICVIDSTGQLQSEFNGCGVGTYVYQTPSGSTTFSTISGYMETDDGMAYIWGAYHGYNDGSTNDTLQRFVTRLYGPDFTTAVSEVPATDSGLTLFPNPTTGRISFTYAPSGKGTQVVVQDLVGRMVQQRNFPAYTEQFHLDLGGLAQGTYLLRLLQGERTLDVRQVVVQD